MVRRVLTWLVRSALLSVQSVNGFHFGYILWTWLRPVLSRDGTCSDQGLPVSWERTPFPGKLTTRASRPPPGQPRGVHSHTCCHSKCKSPPRTAPEHGLWAPENRLLRGKTLGSQPRRCSTQKNALWAFCHWPRWESQSLGGWAFCPAFPGVRWEVSENRAWCWPHK